jgi:hypothetical protein
MMKALMLRASAHRVDIVLTVSSLIAYLGFTATAAV